VDFRSNDKLQKKLVSKCKKWAKFGLISDGIYEGATEEKKLS